MDNNSILFIHMMMTFTDPLNIMETTIKTPVQIAISEFGGVRPLARAIHRDPASVCKWQRGDGTIPTSIQKKLLETAWDRGYQISAHEIIFGRE